MMLKSRRMAVIPLSTSELAADLDILDSTEAGDQYDAFTFGSWSSLVLANGSGSSEDTAFKPHNEPLRWTDLGRQLTTVRAVVERHFRTDHLQWVRVFRLHHGILAPHVDFLEFEQPGVRLQLPLRTDPDSLHTENDIVYHLRTGEVWRIHTTEPHSAYSASPTPRLSLCLDFAEGHFDPERDILDDVEPAEDVHIANRPGFADGELEELTSGVGLTRETARDVFGRLAAVHFRRRSHSAEVFDWFERAAANTGDTELVDKARAFRVYCIQKRSYQEDFVW